LIVDEYYNIIVLNRRTGCSYCFNIIHTRYINFNEFGFNS